MEPIGRASLLAVNVARIDQSFFCFGKRLAAITDRAEETAFISLVAGGARLLHLNQQRVAIAIEGDIFNDLHMSARFALDPILLARSAPKHSFTQFNRL